MLRSVYMQHWEEFRKIRQAVFGNQAAGSMPKGCVAFVCLRVDMFHSPFGQQHRDGNQAAKTLECSIVDIADDIAYAVYDIVDAFKYRIVDAHTMKLDLLPVFYGLTQKHRGEYCVYMFISISVDSECFAYH